MAKAIVHDKVDVRGYMVWSLLGEWITHKRESVRAWRAVPFLERRIDSSVSIDF